MNFKLPISSSRGWATSPDLLCVIVKNIISHKPRYIMEIGSGVSSQILGCCLRDINLKCKIISLDNSKKYAKITSDEIEIAGLSDYVKVEYTPMQNYEINNVTYEWYDIKKINIPPIDMLLIDGPIGKLKHKARYPAVPILLKYLSEDCVIILDDFGRNDEQVIVKDWLKENKGLSLISELNTEKGTAILKMKKID